MLRSLQFQSLVLATTLVCTACATTAPARLPVAPEPAWVPAAWTEDCRALGSPTHMKHEGQTPPYGWTTLRIDVERGVVTRVVIVDSSPKGVFDEAALAVYRNTRFASMGSAKNCPVSHKWD